ncbi:hypothetical protein KIW84_070870 [Lathyrus oleraceus]|uniref:Uncharacterized protein n=1 Tax=Pisum sativum TaxID=3888 RepID=A0A9D4VGU6_PEA|nr:hypothetical protein KIW84_070870 [Pisum sativum]
MSSPFYPAYVSSPPVQAKYILIAYIPKSSRTTTTSTSKTKGKATCLSASSSDSHDIPEIPPPKFQKEEEIPDKGLNQMAVLDSPLMIYHLSVGERDYLNLEPGLTPR